VILTGMGNDGSQGIEAVKRAGGLTLAESEETAVVYGMPKEALATGRVDEVLSLDAIVARLVRFAHGR
jgi:two-component system, chemotaxis family, protein-glutamate methylesterase/glutaminase